MFRSWPSAVALFVVHALTSAFLADIEGQAVKQWQGRCLVKCDSLVAILLCCGLEACLLFFFGCDWAIVICVSLSVFHV